MTHSKYLLYIYNKGHISADKLFTSFQSLTQCIKQKKVSFAASQQQTISLSHLKSSDNKQKQIFGRVTSQVHLSQNDAPVVTQYN